MQTRAQIDTFLDRFGRAMAEAGLGAEAGRVLGWLVVADPACQTAQEVARATGLDEGEVNGMLEGLTTWGLLDRVPLEGRTCFASKDLGEMMLRRVAVIAQLRHALDDVLPALTGDAHHRAAELRRFYALTQEELPAMVKLARTGTRR
jgi:hypothetical protein